MSQVSCLHYISSVCCDAKPDNKNTQLCVVSVGLNLEGVAASLIHKTALRNHSGLYCIVLPDGSPVGKIAKVSSSIDSRLKILFAADKQCENKVQPLSVRPIVEGCGTRERCSAYQSGGAFVLSSRVLCADLLHKRICNELIVLCIILFPFSNFLALRKVESFTSTMAFCVEILLRGSFQREATALSSLCSHVVMLSDHPSFLQYACQRHQKGAETFSSLFHIGDIQLFPRFRLELMRHFEKVSEKKRFVMDRVVVAVSQSKLIMDGLLRKILVEIFCEINKLYNRLEKEMGADLSTRPYSSMEEEKRTSHVPPRSRARKEADDPAIQSSTTALLGLGYMTEDEFCCPQNTRLDTNLSYSLQLNDPNWAYRSLIESAIDVRRLRNALRRQSPYDFFFCLADTLDRSVPMRRSGYYQNVSPEAPWTLSSHFSDLLTVATHRICVVEKKTHIFLETNDGDPRVPCADSADDDDGDDDVVCVGESIPACSLDKGITSVRAPPRLLPNYEELDYDLELVNRVCVNWCRAEFRRSKKASSNKEAMLIFTFGSKNMFRLSQRLTHTLEEYHKIEFNAFLDAYKCKYGVNLQSTHSESAVHASTRETHIESLSSSRSRTTYLLSSLKKEAREDVDVDADAHSSDEDTFDDNYDGLSTDALNTEDASDRRGHERASSSPQKPGYLFSQPLTQNTSVRTENTNGFSLHDILLSQQSFEIVDDDKSTDNSESATAISFHVDHVCNGLARLVARGESDPSADTPTQDSQAFIILADGHLLTSEDIYELLMGNHFSLCVDSKPSILVKRVIVTQEDLSLLRKMEMAQDSVDAERLRNVKSQLIGSSFSQEDFAKSVENEREAFKELAKVKSSLVGQLLSDVHASRRVEEALEEGKQLSSRRGSRKNYDASFSSLEGPEPSKGANIPMPMVVFDEREFRSSLPYSLYKRGIDLVPLMLSTGDYILSPQYAVERKSVPDFIQSIQSGRISAQLAALSRRFQTPLCLIEFSRASPFRLTYMSQRRLSSEEGSEKGSYCSVYSRLARLVAANPRVRWLWSRSPEHSAEMIFALKKTCASEAVDPSEASLTHGGIDVDLSSQSNTEASHYAAGVLSKFPGVTPKNARIIMNLCGSLASLGTISKESLEHAIGAEDGGKLYNFVHSKFAVEVT